MAEDGVFGTKPPVVEKKSPEKRKPDYWVGKPSFGAFDVHLNWLFEQEQPSSALTAVYVQPR